MISAATRAREAWEGAESGKASSEERSESSSGDGEGLTRTTSVGSEKKRLGESGEAEDWEAREKRRRKGKHGKRREPGNGKARAANAATLDDSARASPSSDAGEPIGKSASMERGGILGARVVVGAALAQGQRAYMEDRYSAVLDLKPDGMSECDGVRRSFLGVFDGHNGEWAAQFASERLHTFLDKEIVRSASPACPEAVEKYNEEMTRSLKKMYMDCDEVILDTTSSQGRRDGSTAVSILQIGNVLFTAHAGDSRAVVGYSDGRTRAMTEDHKPSTMNERRRITAIGGRIEFCGCWRVIADHPYKPVRAALAVSRSLGDIDFKRPTDTGVTAEPDINRFELDENINFVILATDGMWDVIRDQEAGDIARAKLAECGVLTDGKCTTKDMSAVEEACKVASQELLDTSLKRGTNDNVTVVVAMYMH